jgi:DNA-binding protein YbaB
LNPANPTQWVEEYEAKLADLKKKSEDLAVDLAASTATVASKDGMVAVTVGPNGGLQNLQLGHRAVELSAPRLTALILETARIAQKQAAGKVLDLFKPLGEGTEAYQMVANTIPDDVAEESDAYGEPEPASTPATAQQPAQVRGRRLADDDDDDDQPW